MTQLERIYFLNVLIYLPSVESIKKFILINKKCKEVSEMVRIYSVKHRTDQHYIQEFFTTIIPQNLLTIYPTVETIECTYKELLNPDLEDIFTQVKLIKLKLGYDNLIESIEEVPIEIREKVIDFKIDIYSKRTTVK